MSPIITLSSALQLWGAGDAEINIIDSLFYSDVREKATIVCNCDVPLVFAHLILFYADDQTKVLRDDFI